MKKGISLFFGYVYDDVEEQIKAIKEAGFDCVMTTADKTFDKENTSIKHQIKLYKKYGLELSSLHMRYKRDELPEFWKDTKIGDRIEKDITKDVKIAHKYGFKCVVVHIVGEFNDIGVSRFKRILKICEKLKMPLALENLRDNDKLLASVFKTIKSDYLKFCYDAGHAHAFMPDIDFLTKYKDKLIALHLHDNLGVGISDTHYKKIGYKESLFPPINGSCYNPDMHTLNKYGNIDWEEVASKLAKVKNDISLDYEVLMCYRKKVDTPQKVLKEIKKQADELNVMIDNHKKLKRKSKC